MNEVPVWKVPKLPFLIAYAISIVVASVAIAASAHPISQTVALGAIACVALGSVLGCLPYIFEYRATGKMLEANAVGTVAEQLGDLKKYSDEISSAASQWALVQEATKGNAEKTVTAAREIATRMTEEIRDFNEFQVKLNDTEKGAMRLEIEKLRRIEGEWLQVVARILDHIFALHNAASHSGNPDLADQIGQFQQACREATRRVGVGVFGAAPQEKFDSQKHRAHGVENPPADAVVAETVAMGMTFQGRLVRPALVRLQDKEAAPAAAPVEASAPAEAAATEAPGENPEASDTGELAFDAD